MNRTKRIGRLLVLVAMLLASPIYAASLQITVTNAEGRQVENAVVYATPRDPATKARMQQSTNTMIDQVDKEFIDHVTPVMVGTAVSFPNNDKIRHHVYSFSPAKTFEILLYKDKLPNPVVFDKPGVVVLGCNIHDWMSAYVFVADTPFFAVTRKSGAVVLKGLPAGAYDVEVWHPGLRVGSEKTRQTLTVTADEQRAVTFQIDPRHIWSVRRAPTPMGGGY